MTLGTGRWSRARRHRRGRPLHRRRARRRARRGRVPMGDVRRQPLRRGAARRLAGAAVTGQRARARGHRHARVLHHAVDVDAGDASPRPGGPAAIARPICWHRWSSGSRRRTRPRDRSGAVNEDCLKLTAYFAERDRCGDRFLGDALLAICERHGLADERPAARRGGLRPPPGPADRPAAQPLRGPADGARGRRLPVDGSRGRCPRSELRRSRAADARAGPDAHRPSRPCLLPEELHEASKLTVYCGRHERVGRRPAFVAIVDLLHRHGR